MMAAERLLGISWKLFQFSYKWEQRWQGKYDRNRNRVHSLTPLQCLSDTSTIVRLHTVVDL